MVPGDINQECGPQDKWFVNLKKENTETEHIMNINTCWPEQRGQYFAENIFKCIFLNKNFGILRNLKAHVWMLYI